MAERTYEQDVEGRARLFGRHKAADVHAVGDVEGAAGMAPTGFDGLFAISLAHGPHRVVLAQPPLLESQPPLVLPPRFAVRAGLGKLAVEAVGDVVLHQNRRNAGSAVA